MLCRNSFAENIGQLFRRVRAKTPIVVRESLAARSWLWHAWSQAQTLSCLAGLVSKSRVLHRHRRG